MEFSASSFQSKSYIVSTPVYEGPLDFLLHLIERAELDITRLALAQVTDQYLEHLHALEEQKAEEVSAFLVIAAKLLQIKSEVLLPRPPLRDPGEEDPGEALIRQLLIYKKFKDIAIYLSSREAEGKHTYLRLAPPPQLNTVLDLDGLSLTDLLQAARSVFLKADVQPNMFDVVGPVRVTIREKIHHIAYHLRQAGRISFYQLFSTLPNTVEIIVTFLAMLELIKRRLVHVHQEHPFGEIIIENEGLNDENEVFELEFSE